MPASLALIGAGRFGRAWLRTIGEARGVRLAAVASRNPATDALLPPGCVRHEDWAATLEAPGLDAVVVATPPALHAPMVERAAALGLAVLVEKPLCLDLAEAERLAARCAGRLVVVDHTHLFAPAYEALRGALAGAAVESVRVEAGAYGPFRADVPVLWDWGAHWMAVCLDLFGGAPQRASVHTLARARIDGRLGEHVRVELTFAGGANALLDLSNLRDQPVRRLDVQSGARRWVYDELAPDPLVLREGEIVHAVAVAGERPLARLLRTFVSALRTPGAPVRSDLAFGVEVVRALEACATPEASPARPRARGN